MPSICEECDYSPAFCDGDVNMCYSAMLYGLNSEKSRNFGHFEDANFNREIEL